MQNYLLFVLKKSNSLHNMNVDDRAWCIFVWCKDLIIMIILIFCGWVTLCVLGSDSWDCLVFHSLSRPCDSKKWLVSGKISKVSLLIHYVSFKFENETNSVISVKADKHKFDSLPSLFDIFIQSNRDQIAKTRLIIFSNRLAIFRWAEPNRSKYIPLFYKENQA